jgi:hypothetical protein
MIELPKAIVWDYAEAPRDELWRLQRLADFFPHYGRDRTSVRALTQRLAELKIPPEVAELIKMYAEYYDRAH